MANLKLTDVGKAYGGNVEVLKNINLDIKTGELIVIVPQSKAEEKDRKSQKISVSDRGIGKNHVGRIDDRWPAHERRAPGAARDCHGFPVVRALSAHDRP